MPTRKTARKASPRKTTSTATPKLLSAFPDNTRHVKERADALLKMSTNVIADRATFRSVAALLSDSSVDSKLRNKALSTIQSATFDPVKFAPFRSAYMTVLRGLRNDPDHEIRQRSFGLLAREQDPDTQAMLLAGLEDPAKALLPPEKALQLLSYDPHAGAYDAARKIEKTPPNPAARREALRVLAADGQSVKLFERVLRDKGEPTEIRQLAASSLNHLAPQRMQAIARDMAMDGSESDDMKTVCLTALANFGDPQALAQDHSLQEQVALLQERPAESGGALKAAADTFKRRYA